MSYQTYQTLLCSAIMLLRRLAALAALALCAAGASAAAPAPPAPMNARYPYQVGDARSGFRPAPPHRGEYIEVLSRPIRTAYGEVFWAQQQPVPLPADFVARFHGKTAAFVGYEADIFRNGSDGTLKSVPCYEQYNHHFAVGLLGNGSKLAFVGRQPYLDERTVNAHRHAPLWEARDVGIVGVDPGDDDDVSDVPTFQMFVEGNGNEYRRSFKYIPEGFAQLLYSPTDFAPNFMFINTNNPDTPDWGPRGGPLPKGGDMPGWVSTGSQAPPNASYSGLLECPCTTRVKKTFTGHAPLAKGTCAASGGGAVPSATECFAASAQVYGGKGFEILKNATVSDAARPAGCYVLATPQGYEVYFNNDTSSTTKCGPSSASAAPRATGKEREPESGVTLSVDLDAKAGVATITLTGTAGAWLGVGFGATKMQDAPYAIIVEPGSDKGPGSRAATQVTERRLANHAAGTALSPTMVSVVSDTVSENGQVRTVVLQRKLAGATAQHYTFDPTASSINFIAAAGTTATFSYHGPTRGGSTLMLVLMGAPVCLCESAEQGGSVNGLPWTSDCFNPELQAQRNPSCDIRTYRGGMTCCHDGVRLLDADQPLPTRQDNFVAKFRFYFESEAVEDTPPTRNRTENAFFLFREVEYNHGEYDVPQAQPGTPPEERVHTLISSFTVRDTIQDCGGNMAKWMCAPSQGGKFPQSDAIDLLHVSGHCHAPSCISMELINADTGLTICLVEPIYGQGGGTHGNVDDIHDEEGYVVGLPPCIWGAAEGLGAPPRLSLDTNLTAIKKSNSTYFHYGVMSHFQMRGAWAPPAVHPEHGVYTPGLK